LRKNSVFYNTFIGEHVQIITKIMQAIPMGDPEGEQYLDQIPLTIYGHVLDADSSYVFLGSTDAGISTAIKHDDIGVIQIVPAEAVEDLTPNPANKALN